MIGVLRPSWASEITSLTPLRPRLTKLFRKADQKVSASEGPMPQADDLAPAIGVDRHGDYRRDRDDAAAVARP